MSGGADETARLRAEAAALRARVEALEGRLAETERANDAKTRMVGHVSHELRAPLGSILGFASLLAAEPEMEPERREEYVGIVLRNARHLLHVVNDILNLSKVEAGTLEVSVSPLRAGDIASAVADSLQTVAAERGVRVRVDDHARHLALADAGRLRQVLLNLLDNAIKYSPAGAPVEVRLDSGEGEVRIEVADAGPGLKPEDQARLFREFSRVSHAGIRVPGAGLGLALAKRLAEAMGGRIGVESAPGRGSTFWVALPAAGAGEDAGGGDGRGARPASAGGVVAVVDDDPDVRAFAAEVLALSGYRAVQDDGRPGVGTRLAAAGPRLVLLDLNLEGRDGVAALRELRGEAALAGVPVLAFTGAALPRDLERVRAAGFDDLLMKPVEPDALAARVDAALARSSPTIEDAPPEEEAPEEDDDYLAPLRARFRSGLPDRLRAMEEAREADDLEALTREAHKLKGAAGGYGYDDLAQLAAAAEGVLRDGAPPTHPSVDAMMRGMREMPAGE